MRKLPVISLFLIGLVLLGSLTFLIFPSLGASTFLSPDETANAVVASQIALHGTAIVSDPYIQMLPWAHPRSFVDGVGGIVPVGFLGMSMVLALIQRVLGLGGVLFFTPILALSVLFPLWSWTKSWGKIGQIGTLVGWLTFPTVILYANRGLFANLPVVCLTIWAAWLLWFARQNESKARPYFIAFSGALAGLALVMRPVEVFWIAPALIVSYFIASQEKISLRTMLIHKIFFVIPFAILLAFSAWFSFHTYGHWLITGYQLRDSIASPVLEAAATTTAPVLAASTRSLFSSWPFGFHPHNVWFNSWSYLVVYLLPWFLLGGVAFILALKQKRARLLLALFAWMIVSLSLVYGQALYQDNVRILAVTLANSFLRYLLPLSVIAAFSLGWCASAIDRKIPRFGWIGAVALMLLMSAFGYWTAFSRDNDGLWTNRVELMRYPQIRDAAVHLLPAQTLIVSDRSDKIFFPTFTAVSPLPSIENLQTALTESSAPVAFYIHTQSEDELQAWSAKEIDLQPLFSAGNETLYIAQTSL